MIIRKNLFDKNNPNIINAYINTTNKTIISNANARTLYVPCIPNYSYTVSRKAGKRFVVGSTEEMPANGVICTTRAYDNTGSELTITTGTNDNYIAVFFYLSTADTLTEQEILNSIKIEYGSEPSIYTPYFKGLNKFYYIYTKKIKPWIKNFYIKKENSNE